jgi:mannose-6-phosphate isomerase-like protein (cupin superfamily)
VLADGEHEPDIAFGDVVEHAITLPAGRTAVSGRPIEEEPMPRLIDRPTVVPAVGNKPKRIEEYAGRVNSGHDAVSIARMVSPAGWVEPGQRPEFEEITVVLKGMLRVEHEGGALDVHAGQAVVAGPGEWVRYSSPGPDGAEYVAICLPAFSMGTVHRDADGA